MRLAIGSDHGGFLLKESIKRYLEELGVDYRDFGTSSEEPVDYPDIARVAIKAILNGDCDRGILVCGTGIGMCVAANKFRGIRAALCHDVYSARLSRNHNDSNVITMGARVIGPGLAKEIIRAWLDAQFEGGRHVRRLDKISEIENENMNENMTE